MQLYNTLTRKKEKFTPIDPNNIRIYSCGPTVYSEPHIGNFKSMCFSDLLRNIIKTLAGYKVTQVMNITDVGHLVSDGDEGEDKMQKGAKKEGITAREVAKKYENKFKDAMKALKVDMFDVMPRATDHIQEQIDLIKSLEEKGYVYKIADGVYFDTSKLDDYGKLMGPNYKKNIEGLKAGARIEDSGKKNPTDFALRKFSADGETKDMERESPRGKGFPGWHIECSAMSHKYLGDHFDIHVGGPEHVSVHHSNEIAQSECGYDITGDRVNYRIHHGVLTVDGGKMSKSLENGYTLQQLADQDIDPLDLRMFFFTAHYRSYQDFTRDGLRAVKTARSRLRGKLTKLNTEIKIDKINKVDNSTTYTSKEAIDFYNKIKGYLLDDLNTVEVLALINKTLATGTNQEILQIIYNLDQNILKLNLFVPLAESEQNADIPQAVIDLAEQRMAAKAEKDYSLADQLRKKIQDFGYEVKDRSDGYIIL